MPPRLPSSDWALFRISLIYLLNFSDKVFGPTCSNLMVYEEGAKDVALSVLTGINGNCKLA